MSFFAALAKRHSKSTESVVGEGKNLQTALIVSTNTTKGKALRDVNFFDRWRMQMRPQQYQRKPHTPPSTPTEAIPHPSYTLLDEHPGHLYHEQPMTGKKTLKPPGGHKQQGQRFADDTNIGKRPTTPELPTRPITYDGKASGRESFYASIEKKQQTAAEKDAKEVAKAKKEGAYVKPTSRAAKASGTRKENEPIGGQSQSPVRMPRLSPSFTFSTSSPGQYRMPQFGDLQNVNGVFREITHPGQDDDLTSMHDAHQQSITTSEAVRSSQRQDSDGNKQGGKTIGDMGPPPIPQHAAKRNAATSKQESRSRVSEWVNSHQNQRPQQAAEINQDMQDAQYSSYLNQGSSNAQGKRSLDHSDDNTIMQETIHRPMASTRYSIPAVNEVTRMTLEQYPPEELHFTPHLLPGARGAARRFPQSQLETGDYEQLFNPEQPLYEPHDPEIRAFIANLVDNTVKTPPFHYRRTTIVPMVNKFKERFLDDRLPAGLYSPRTHAEITTRNANSRMYADRIDNLLRLCDAIECLLYCMLPHNKRRYPAPLSCPSRKNPPVFPPCPDEKKLFVADNLYDESVQLLTDAVGFIMRFEEHGISEDPLLVNNEVKVWFAGFEQLENSLNRIGVIVNVIGNRCKCGQWDYVASMGEVLNAVGGIWTVVTGTLRPPNWEGRIPHLSVGINPANIPANSMIVELRSPQAHMHPPQPATLGSSSYNYQQQANTANQVLYFETTSPSKVATLYGYGRYPSNTYRAPSNYRRSQHPSATYQRARNSGYDQYPSTTFHITGNEQWVSNPTPRQLSNNDSTFSYPQQTSTLGQQTSTTNTAGPAWYEVLPDGTQLNPYCELNRSLD